MYLLLIMNPNRAMTCFAWSALKNWLSSATWRSLRSKLGVFSMQSAFWHPQLLTARSPGVKLNYLHCISIRFLREININQAWFSIEDGIYEAKSKTELISLGYAQAKVKKSKRYNEDSFWEEFVYFLLIIKPNRAITCLAWSALENWSSSATWRSLV